MCKVNSTALKESVLTAALGAAFFAVAARADTITYLTSYSTPANAADGGQTVAGQADFYLDTATSGPNKLIIDLTSLTTQPNMQSQADLLTAMQFELTPSTLSLSNGHATGQTVTVGSDLQLSSPTPASPTLGNLDNGWGGGNLSGNPDEYAAASGLNLGSGHSFDGTPLDGSGYGLITAGIGSVANKDGFPQHGPYTYGTVQLVFDISGPGNSYIANVEFLFGTKPDATIAGVGGLGQQIQGAAPLPSSFAGGLILLGGIAGVCLLRKRYGWFAPCGLC